MSKFHVGQTVGIAKKGHLYFGRTGQVSEQEGPVAAVELESGEVLNFLAVDLIAEETEYPDGNDYASHVVPTPRRTRTLNKADDLINGDRQDDYGPPAENFQRIADLWTPVLGVKVTAVQVALCLAQLKVARLITSPRHTDSWIDSCGYMALGSEIAEDHA